MIISSATDIGATDCFRYAWSGLRRFKNVEFTTKKIMQYQGVPTSQRHNVEKQARQIRYCINQAEEYFEAGRVVSLATRPLLYYYGLMSLALAEILIKQDGNASLDRARGQHAHHGLDLRTDADPSRLFRLHESAAALRCVPLKEGHVENALARSSFGIGAAEKLPCLVLSDTYIQMEVFNFDMT
jgi:hypothetical protein